MGYGIALLGAGLAIVSAVLTEHYLDGAYFATPLAVVALVGLLAGFLPGVVTTIVVVAGFAVLFEPSGTFAMANAEDAFRLVAFVAAAIVVSVVAGAQGRVRDRLAVERGAAQRAAEEAQRSNDALRESEARNRAAADALLETDRRKDEFLAVLSHELRNPLAPITMALEVLEREPAPSEGAQRAVTIISRQVGQLSRLVDDLLDVTRVGRGKLELHRVPLELAALVRRTVEDFEAELVRCGLSIDVEVDPEPIWVDADETRLAQVLGNLLHNSAKFTPRGGRVRVILDRDDGRARLRVIDTGIGISKDLLPQLFDPFVQAEHTLDRRTGGLGLGLALVKSLVDLHGGSVEARSHGENTGAELTVLLPTIDPPTIVGRRRTSSRHAVTGSAGHGRRVLIIEDNVDAAEMLKLVLEEAGQMEVEVAHEGSEGLDRAHRFRPDIVLCDIGLPGMTGYEVAESLRSSHDLSDTKLVAVTGYSSPADRERAKKAGFDAHLTKPVSYETVRQVIEGT